MVLGDKREIFLSISSNPGSFGETVHNAGYNYYGLNYFYKAIKVKKLAETIEGIKALNIRGCSVSMPFKRDVIKYLDIIDEEALQAGAVNTVLNELNQLKGFNTDIYGAYKALASLNPIPIDTVLLLGSGGVARAIIVALKKLNISKIYIAGRTYDRAKKLAESFSCEYLDWDSRNSFKSTILINATPVGMKYSKESSLMPEGTITNFKKIFDVVVSKGDTELIKNAKKNSLRFATGLFMTFFQAEKQFQIYTNREAPLLEMVKAYNTKNKSNFCISAGS